MAVAPSTFALILSATLTVGYFTSMWWLLRKEGSRPLLLLLCLTAATAALHLYDVWNLPPGINDDELKTLKRAVDSWRGGGLFGNGFEAPILYAVLFQAPVAMLVDSTFWGMRAYPLTLGILAVPVAFAICRGLRFSLVASFVGASLVGTLPWALFWGRMPWGGEIIFYEALLLAGVSRIVWRDGGLMDVVVAMLGLIGLLYEYTAAWAMIGIPPLAFLLAHSWR